MQSETDGRDGCCIFGMSATFLHIGSILVLDLCLPHAVLPTSRNHKFQDAAGTRRNGLRWMGRLRESGS
jgi:hypothetical protein